MALEEEAVALEEEAVALEEEVPAAVPEEEVAALAAGSAAGSVVDEAARAAECPTPAASIHSTSTCRR